MENNFDNILAEYQKSPIAFICDMWDLSPERDNYKFTKGENITWQQHDILLAVENALNGKAPRRISIRAGHGIGKSTTFAWLVIWFLFCYHNAQIPCTAPTADQMHDVLWKEVKKWLNLLPEEFKHYFDWSAGYIRMTSHPETWFARAKTARKESPEALAGVHGDHVMFLVDEASGVPEEIFNTAEGALTEEGVLFLMISNPTRLIGYFYDSHHGDKENWQALHFSCLDSPVVDNSYVERIKEKHGEDSDEYRVRVLGDFPKEDAVDGKGYVPLFSENDIREIGDVSFIGNLRMGIDPAGDGKDETNWVIRDSFKAKIVATEKKSTPKSIARTTLTLFEHFGVRAENTWLDSFGEGADALKEIALAGYNVNGVNTGKKADDDEKFLNKRAEIFWRVREWVRNGGEFIEDKRWLKESKTLRYRAELSGKLKFMGKQEMKKEGFDSPNALDALSLTFIDEEVENVVSNKQMTIRRNQLNEKRKAFARSLSG